VRRHGGRITGRIYTEHVHGPAGRVASMYDASITGFDPDPTSDRSPYRDPFTAALGAPLTSAMQEIYASRLNYRTERSYEKLSREVNRNWIWGNSPTPPESVSDLQESLALDPRFRVLVVHGFTDLVTPYFASELVLDQIPSYGDRQRVNSIVYPGGHMFYSRDASRKAFREDVFNLVERIIVEANTIKLENAVQPQRDETRSPEPTPDPIPTPNPSQPESPAKLDQLGTNKS